MNTTNTVGRIRSKRETANVLGELRSMLTSIDHLTQALSRSDASETSRQASAANIFRYTADARQRMDEYDKSLMIGKTYRQECGTDPYVWMIVVGVTAGGYLLVNTASYSNKDREASFTSDDETIFKYTNIPVTLKEVSRDSFDTEVQAMIDNVKHSFPKGA